MAKVEELKEIAQLRKALMPLIEIVKSDTLESVSELVREQLQTFGKSLEIVANKDIKVEVPTPQVAVNVDTNEISEVVSKLSKSQPKLDISDYKPHDQAKKGAFQYSGFVAQDGSWYIQRVAKGEQRYVKGKGNYSEAWETKSKQKYGYFGG